MREMSPFDRAGHRLAWAQNFERRLLSYVYQLFRLLRVRVSMLLALLLLGIWLRLLALGLGFLRLLGFLQRLRFHRHRLRRERLRLLRPDHL